MARTTDSSNLGILVRAAVVLALSFAGPACLPGGAASSSPQPRGPQDPEADRAEIREVYRTFASRLSADDRLGAVALIDRESLAFYEAIRRDALTLSATALRARPPHEQVTIINFRQGKTRASLQTQPITELIAAGLTPLIDPARTQLHEIVVNGDRATVQLGLDGATLRELGLSGARSQLDGRVPLELRRDPEGWRLNFVVATRFAADRILDGDTIEEVAAFLAKYYGVDLETLYAPPR